MSRTVYRVVTVGSRRGGISLVEDQVDDLEHRGEPRVQFVASWHLEWHLLFQERPLCAHDSLCDCRLRCEKGSSDFRGGEPSEKTERQRDACLHGQHGM